MRLDKKMQKWVAQGFITQQQADNILTAEKENQKGFAWKTLFSVAGLFIGLGFILLIGANWDSISNGVKLVSAFSFFAALLYGVYWTATQGKNDLKELFLILSFLMVAGLIGLIAQIFNLSGGWHSFAVGWALLTFVLLGRSMFFNLIWLILLGSAIDWGFINSIYRYLGKSMNDDSAILILYIGMTGVLALLSYAGEQLYAMVQKKIVLPKAFSKLTYFLMYLTALFGGIIVHFDISFVADVFVFIFLGIRMYMTFKQHNMVGFRNNTVLAELYVVFLFVSAFENLFISGIGFILAGVLLLGVISMLKKTTVYIKGMEAFNEK